MAICSWFHGKISYQSSNDSFLKKKCAKNKFFVLVKMVHFLAF